MHEEVQAPFKGYQQQTTLVRRIQEYILRQQGKVKEKGKSWDNKGTQRVMRGKAPNGELHAQLVARPPSDTTTR